MSNTTEGRAPTLAEGIMALVDQYGEAIAEHHTADTTEAGHNASLRACELRMEIGEALRTHRLPTPGFGAELNRAFGLTPYEPDLDHGINSGPASVTRQQAWDLLRAWTMAGVMPVGLVQESPDGVLILSVRSDEDVHLAACFLVDPRETLGVGARNVTGMHPDMPGWEIYVESVAR